MEIKLGREYTTRKGDDVIIHEISPLNSAGFKVTFPVKGTIVRKLKKGNRVKREYNIWRLDGRISIWGEREDDLILKDTF